MCSTVTSEIWQDQFLQSLSTDIFQDFSENENATEDDSNASEPEAFITNFVAESSRFKKSDEKDEFFNSERRYTIECLQSSSVDLVGLQVWRGALLLSDYILTHPEEFCGKSVLELAAGTGITSIVVSELASKILCTDVDRGEILATIRRNFEQNSELAKAQVTVDEIDFFAEDWKSNLDSQIQNVQVILVADVVYDPDLTRKFFSTLHYILDQARDNVIVYFSIEKRNRVDESGKILAPNFNIFVDLLHKLSLETGFKLVPKAVEFEQRFRCYERVEELHMWKLFCEKLSSNNTLTSQG